MRILYSVTLLLLLLLPLHAKQLSLSFRRRKLSSQSTYYPAYQQYHRGHYPYAASYHHNGPGYGVGHYGHYPVAHAPHGRYYSAAPYHHGYAGGHYSPRGYGHGYHGYPGYGYHGYGYGYAPHVLHAGQHGAHGLNAYQNAAAHNALDAHLASRKRRKKHLYFKKTIEFSTKDLHDEAHKASVGIKQAKKLMSGLKRHGNYGKLLKKGKGGY